MSLEEDLSIPSLESPMAEPNSTAPQTSQFLRVPQIQTSFSSRVRSEPLIDYSHFQILTSTDHVGKLTQISEKKVEIERARARKQKERELTKAKRDQERWLQLLQNRERLLIKKPRKLQCKSGQKLQLGKLERACKGW